MSAYNIQSPLLLQHVFRTNIDHHYAAGIDIFRQGSPATDVYLVVTGLIKLVRTADNGKAVITELLYANQMLGIAAVVLDSTYPVTATTINPCNLSRVAAPEFRYFLKSDPSLTWADLELLSEDTCRYSHLAELNCMSARERLEHYLHNLLLPSGRDLHDAEVHLPVKHWELAEILAITPEYLSRLLHELESEGILLRGEGGIVVIAPEKLWHLNGIFK